MMQSLGPDTLCSERSKAQSIGFKVKHSSIHSNKTFITMKVFILQPLGGFTSIQDLGDKIVIDRHNYRHNSDLKST